jgi:hypothetical protein
MLRERQRQALTDVPDTRPVISKLNGTPFDSHTYVPDAVGNILQESINGAPANTFGYDDVYRLTSSSVGGVASSWVYL